MLNSVLSLLFPKYCLSCKKVGSDICSVCIKKLVPWNMTFYPRGYVDEVRSFYLYTYVLKRIIQAAKYQSISSGLRTVCNLCDLSPSTSEVFVPIPMFPSKQKVRGFNQAEIIARMWSYQCDAHISTHLVRKAHNTKPQAHCTAQERYQNVQDAFVPHERARKVPETVTLVDDVWTTGTTMQAVAKVCKDMGVKKVTALTLARARDG